MVTALGLLGILVFIAGMIAFAAAITWTVVKISPSKGAKKPSPSE